MKKRCKTDYFEKLCLLAKICNDNISYAHKIITSQQIISDYTVHTGKDIMNEVKANLEKDYFAPFEREDIFMLGEKLNELSENTFFLYTNVSHNNFFVFPGNFASLIECLMNASAAIYDIFINLSESQKSPGLNNLISKAEKKQKELKKRLYESFNQSQKTDYTGIFHHIEKCADSCKEIIQLIQYTLLKNS